MRAGGGTEPEWLEAIRFLTATGKPEYNLRGRLRTDEDGRYAFRTVLPVSYSVPTDGPVGCMLKAMGRHPWRPAHCHFIISAPGCETLTTHLFVEGNKYLDSDAVFGVKNSLVVKLERHDSAAEAKKRGCFSGPLLVLRQVQACCRPPLSSS